MLLTNKTNEVIMVLILVLFNFGCNNSSLNNRMDDSDYVKENTSTANSPINESKGVKVKEEVIYDGVYVGSQLVSEGYELKAELIVNGDKWTAKSQMSYGIVRGKRLYDESGMVEIGYITGKSASINGYPVMTK